MLLSINVELIRKKYIKWIRLEIFSKINKRITCLDFGYFNGYNINIKIKNKKASVLAEHNKILHIIDISKWSEHNAKRIEQLI